MPPSRATAAVPLTLLFALAGPVGGQTTLALEPVVRVATAYEGRGLTFHEGLAGQLTLDLALGGDAGELRAGAWTNFELLRSDDGRPTMIAGAAPGPSEVNLYLTASRGAGRAVVTGGWIYFLWPTGFDFSDASPLHEVFVSLDVPLPLATPVSVHAAAYYDFAARGVYAELSAAAPLPPVLGVTPRLGASIGAIVDEPSRAALDGGARSGHPRGRAGRRRPPQAPRRTQHHDPLKARSRPPSAARRLDLPGLRP